MDDTIQLGQHVRDEVTGFEGIVTSRVEYLTGCTQYGVTPRAQPDGKLPDGHYFDFKRLRVIDKGVSETVEGDAENGGDMGSAAPPMSYRG